MSSRWSMSAWFTAMLLVLGSLLLVEYIVLLGGSRGTSTQLWQASQPLPSARRREAVATPAMVDQSSFDHGGETRQDGEDGGEEDEDDQERKELMERARRLGVVVPAHTDDLERVQNSLATWPIQCHRFTLVHTDLIIYYAGGENEDVADVLAAVAQTGGRCFANTRLVLANLSEEEKSIPKVASVQFYKLYLDSRIRPQFVDYDALAIIEWKVIVAHDRSFEKLYTAAFGRVEPFWVKGSALVGDNFHEIVVRPESRQMVGHINGNAIYNNTDPGFVDYVNFTLTRWEYTLSYDAALWATIYDFPYSWTLWQRFSEKFVTTDLIANVGDLHVNHQTVLEAVAIGTLFIYSTLTHGGGSMIRAPRAALGSSPALRLLGDSNRLAEGCTVSCGTPLFGAATAASGTGTVCDRSCFAGGRNGARFGGHLCGAGDVDIYGAHCRTCFDNLEVAQAAEESLALQERVAFEKTSATRFERMREEKNGRMAASADGGGVVGWPQSGGSRRGGDRGDRGEEGEGGDGVRELVGSYRSPEEEGHRDVERMQDGDTGGLHTYIEKQRHVIMCDTLMPPPVAAGCSHQCQANDDTVCDRSCGTGRYGDYNCDWRGYGAKCRFCFNDREKAMVANEVAKQRGGSVIMCHTFEPPTEEEDWEPTATAEYGGAVVGRERENGADAGNNSPPTALPAVSTIEATSYDPAEEPFAKEITRGQICAFMTSSVFVLKETQVTVKSIGQFMPGVRVAIATEAEDVSIFERTLGTLPGVRISEAGSPITRAALLADRHCGEGTELILYMKAGELLSRTFTPKDTHSATGDLLVMYTTVDQVSRATAKRALSTMSVLGFKSPSFSSRTDIMLPVDANRELRRVLLSDPEVAKKSVSIDTDTLAVNTLGKFPGVFVPEVLAALAYSRNVAGLWFINPKEWVTHHMFQQASIWDIPLVKPRFSCAIDISMAIEGYDVAVALEEHLSHFVRGSSCQRGFIPLDQASLKAKASIEFGFPTGKDMPSIAMLHLRISVVFYADRSVSPTLLDASLSSVVARFPEAAEVVVVFTEPPIERYGLKEILMTHIKQAPFPVEIIQENEQEGPAFNDRSGWSGLRADDHSSEQFVMRLEVGDILVTQVTYENVFHFGKPVIPFRRLSAGEGSGSSAGEADSSADQYIACGVEATMDNDGMRDFAIVKGLAYPRAAYSAIRKFATEGHNVDIDVLVGLAHKHCRGILRQSGPLAHRGKLEDNLLGSFVWRFMHDMVHWRGLDPLDIEPDEWLSDPDKYDLWCSLGPLDLPQSKGKFNAKELLKRVNSRTACDHFSYKAHIAR